MRRLFVAIRPPELVRDLLLDLMEDSEDLRWVGGDNLHLTLKFIGEVERPLANDIAAALAAIRYPAFDLAIHGVGQFTRRNGGALWAGVVSREPVAALAAKVDRACVSAGLEPEHRAFHPHITLARWNRRSRGVAQLVQAHNRLTSDPWRVGAFTLFESRLSRHGAHYEEVANFALA